MSIQPDLQPWERKPNESSKAYAALTVYRDAGAARTLVATAQSLHKSYSLIRRWASRYHWQERVHAWDTARAREDEATLVQARQEMVRRKVQDMDRLQRVAMAKLTSVVSRDPVTGDLVLDPEVTPTAAVRIYRLSMEIERDCQSASKTDPLSASKTDPPRMVRQGV